MEHDMRVREVAGQVRALDGGRAHIDKGGVHHVVPFAGDRRFGGRRVDASTLTNVLSIDTESRTCTAEPGIPFADLVEQTLPHGLLPAVVPELKGITIGGAVAGCSVESMSYRYGGFHDTCLSYEFIDGTGEVRNLSRAQDPFLFEMIHGSYGTLGVLAGITFNLVPAKPYVHMTYVRHESPESFFEDLLRHTESGEHDFIDGIVHAPNDLVLCLGNFEETAPYTSDYTRTRSFYRSTKTLAEDHLTTFDYCFRYDTDAHWLTRTAPPLEWRWVRALIGRFMLGSTNLIKWSGRLEPLMRWKKRPEVVADVFIPARRFLDFCKRYEQDMGFYPLWVVPYRVPRQYPWLSNEHVTRMGDDLFIDCAVYGMKNNGATDASPRLEELTYDLDGIKALIGRNHYSAERFWSIYNRPNYSSAKKELDPNGAFPDLYAKLGNTDPPQEI
jgi:FAD/FMN-containing dehydrogenase